jgi:hypothetical protein
MKGNDWTTGDRDTFLENFASEFTAVAYPIALRHGVGGLWLDLELDLWRVLAGTVEKWGRDPPRVGWPGESETWRQSFLAELTEAAYSTALRRGLAGSFLELEFGLYRAFRSVIEDRSMGRRRR